jgi:hypothetical protein
MKRTLVMLAFSLLMLAVSAGAGTLQAQDNACPIFVESALTAVGSNCAELGRNSICYGFNRVDTSFFDEANVEAFVKPTDRIALTNVSSVQTAPLDHTFDQWGIAVIKAQADVPNTLPGTAVTFLLLGAVDLQNEVSPDEALEPGASVPVVIATANRVNLRGGPGTDFNVVESVATRTILDAVGKNAAGDWLRVVRESGFAWIAAQLVTVSPDNRAAFDALPVVSNTSLTPMQAFYFSTGIGTSTCLEAPEMLVIQGPKEARVNLRANGVDINIGSTIVMTAERTDFGTLAAFEVQGEKLLSLGLPDATECLHNRLVVLDGDAEINNGALDVPLGHFTQSVSCLNSEGDANAFTTWDEPLRLDQNQLMLFSAVELIPESLLRYPIEIPSDEDIDRALQAPLPTVTPRPSTGGQTGPRPTPRPGQTQPTQPPAQQGFNCSGFRTTSPPEGGTVVYGPNTFYWDGVAGANAYQLEINVFYDDGTRAGGGLYRIGANQTNLTLDLASHQFGSGTNIRWRAQVLQGAEPNFVAVCDTPYVSNRIVFP